MKLFIYNKENSIATTAKGGNRTVRINRSNGVIYLSRMLAKSLSFRGGEKMIIANDEDNPKDWYLGKTNNENGFDLRDDKGGVRFINKCLALKILDSAKVEANSTFLVAKEPINIDGVLYYKIITSSSISRTANGIKSNTKCKK